MRSLLFFFALASSLVFAECGIEEGSENIEESFSSECGIEQGSGNVEESSFHGDEDLSRSRNRSSLEFRVSYFYPSSSFFRDLFPGKRNDFQVTGTTPLYYGNNQYLRGINLWGAFDYFEKKGKSLGSPSSSIKFIMTPVTVGLKYFFPQLSTKVPLHFYFAGGAKYYFTDLHIESSPLKDISRNGMGGVVEFGLALKIKELVIADLFSSYSIKRFSAPSFSNSAIRGDPFTLNGFNFGGGLGFSF